jgi:hypothetical protein
VIGTLRRRAASWPRPLTIELAVVLIGVAIALVVSAHGRSTVYNNYALQADAWKHGRLYIDWPGPQIDAVEFQGKHYPIDGPFPALFMLPLTMFYGAAANETWVAMTLCVIAIMFAWLLLVRLGVARTPRLWLTLFLFAGTDMWWCAYLGDVWFMAHITCVGLIFAILLELTGKRRGWLVGLLVVCAAFSRFTSLLAVPFWIFLMTQNDLVDQVRGWREEHGASIRMRLFAFAEVFTIGAFVWVIYNFMIWGLWYDIGHWEYYHRDSYGQPTGSPFRLQYLPYEIYSYFFRAPVLKEGAQFAEWPFLNIDTKGIALTFTSPALILAFWARIPLRLKAALWITTALTAAPVFTYYLDGWVQFGMRHALDFEPFLFVLMAFAVRLKMPLWGAILIGWSALAGLWGIWWWNSYMRGSG